MSFEAQMRGKRESKMSEKKSIAFNAITNDSDSTSEDDEEIAFMTRNFRKFLKYRKVNNFRRSDNNNQGVRNDLRCFNSDKPDI